ncbi:MAG: glycosyltransferase [Burkholderiales bacterium]
MPTISLIIAVYRRLDALELIFKGLQAQSFKDFEVIVAEDDDLPETKQFVRLQNAAGVFPVKHVFQEDTGFRKNRILNAAIRIAAAESVVFLDGDCIPHRHLLREYARRLQPNLALYGRRAMLSESLTAELLRKGNLGRLTFPNLLLSGCRRAEDALYLPWLPMRRRTSSGIWGCNWGVLTKHLVDVNGFDEDYVKASVGEDADIGWRLHASGVAMQSVKHKAVTYHLYHRPHYDQAIVRENLEIFLQKKSTGRFFCRNGLDKRWGEGREGVPSAGTIAP